MIDDFSEVNATKAQKQKEYQRRSYQKHKEKRRKERRKYYANNKEEILRKTKERRENNKEEMNKKTFERRNKNPKNNILYLLSSAKTRCKKSGLEFNVSIESIEIPERCPLLGVTLDYRMSSEYNPNRASIDRIDSSKGYVAGNVWVISLRANRIKSDATPDELEAIAKKTREAMKNAEEE